MNARNKKIILGSGSPRRKELLTAIWDGEIEVIKSDIEEIYPDDIALAKVPLYLAKLKGNDLKSKVNLQENILITADTIVLCEDKILGKPMNKIDANSMLQFLSEKVHQVYTAVAIYHANTFIAIEEKTDVYFGKLNKRDIEFYLDNCQPLDKAGSYGIQEYIGMIGIEKINGCYYNVMGLPTNKVWRELSKL